MEKRFAIFLVLAFAILLANSALMNWLNPPKPKPVAQQGADAAAETDKAKDGAPAASEPGTEAKTDAAKTDSTKSDEQPADAEGGDKKPQEDKPAEPAADQPTIPESRVTLGSADPKSDERLLVTIVNRGAAVERIELNSLSEQDQEDHSGYLGHLDVIDSVDPAGALVGVVGAGTPAGDAGMQAGDVIVAIDDAPVANSADLERVMIASRPGQEMEINYSRGGEKKIALAKLRRRPMEVIRPDDLAELLKHWERRGPHILRPTPEQSTPSFLLTLEQVDDRKLGEQGGELVGVDLESGIWEIAPGADSHQVEFHKTLRGLQLEVVKRYELSQIDPETKSLGYSLNLTVELRNLGDAARKVSYRLYGPNGLPTEGWWYASKISRNWGGAGPRDIVLGVQERDRTIPSMISAGKLASGKDTEPRRGTPLTYIGVDAQYFSAVMIPQKDQPVDDWFYEWQPLTIGPIPKEGDKQRLANVTFRLTSQTAELPAGGAAPLKHTYKIFAGPKKPAIVDAYNLSQLVYYGWPIFAAVAKPMGSILHTFYAIVRNYGLAIIMLTVLVRSCMMPLSRKQAMAAQKMQELQPELKKLQEKHKTNMEARSKAQRELFQKHNYNPLGGCLPMFVQLPIFIGLYRSLSVDIELRQAPLLWAGGWASNLAAPDMLFRWTEFMPGFILGWLGPYFNLLPVITIVLFIVQQKMFMPPPTDEQAAMQQKMMQYMMVFIGVMFFKVPSGLCIYFIASSLWGLAERKFIPKPGAKKDPPTGELAANKLPAPPGGNGANGASGKKRTREKR